MSGQNDQDIEFYFRPSESIDNSRLLGEDDREAKSIVKLATLASRLRSTFESTGLKNWEITLEGYLETSTGFLPGGKAGFKAALKLSNV